MPLIQQRTTVPLMPKQALIRLAVSPRGGRGLLIPDLHILKASIADVSLCRIQGWADIKKLTGRSKGLALHTMCKLNLRSVVGNLIMNSI